MPKKLFENQRASNEKPPTIRRVLGNVWRAFLNSIPKADPYTPYVSHTVHFPHAQTREETEQEWISPFRNPLLTTENHAVNIGKMIMRTRAERLAHVFSRHLAEEPASRERLYTEEVIAGLLKYVFDRLGPDQKGIIVIGRSLSEIFNGPQDVEYAMPLEKQKELIYRIAKKRFKKTEEDIIVLEMEEQELHQPLFKALRGAIDPSTKELDIEKAYGGDDPLPVDREMTSLDIARYLFRASKAHEEWEGKFQGAVPGELKTKSEKHSNFKYYALTEVAIRLAEIMNGRVIHGGVERQAKYDDVIDYILKGSDRARKNFPDMKELFDLFHEKPFETLHLDTENNYYRLAKIRSAFLARSAVALALAATAVGGSVLYGQHLEHQRAEAAQHRLYTDVSFAIEHGARLSYGKPLSGNIPSEELPLAVEQISKFMEFNLQKRYDVPGKFMDLIRPMIADFLIAHKEDAPGLYPSPDGINDFLDYFVFQNAHFLKNLGVHTDYPYARLVEKILKGRWISALATQQDMTVNSGSVDLDTRISKEKKPINPGFGEVGTFYYYPPRHMDVLENEARPVTFYNYTNPNDVREMNAGNDRREPPPHYLVANADAPESRFESYGSYSTQAAREKMEIFKRMERRSLMATFHDWHAGFRNSLESGKKLFVSRNDPNLKSVRVFQDPFREFGFVIGLYENPEDGRPYVLSQDYPDRSFTTDEDGSRVAKIYFEYRY